MYIAFMHLVDRPLAATAVPSVELNDLQNCAKWNLKSFENLQKLRGGVLRCTKMGILHRRDPEMQRLEIQKVIGTPGRTRSRCFAKQIQDFEYRIACLYLQRGRRSSSPLGIQVTTFCMVAQLVGGMQN